MIRTLAALAVAACIAAPVLADHTPDHKSMRVQSKDGRTESIVLGMREVTISSYPSYERMLPGKFWQEAYYLSPREFRRMRAMGLSTEQVFMIANAASYTGLDTKYFVDAFFRGDTPRMISTSYGITPNMLIRVLPEWKTQEWATATGQSAFDKDTLRYWW